MGGYSKVEATYGGAAAGALAATIFQPEGEGPFPAVVEVHGGAWTSNDRFTNVAIHETLAARGVVVMAIDFRMPPDVRYPEPIADINLAIRWLKAHAADYKVDPERVGLVGTSSGGHQAMLAAMRPRDGRYAAHALEDCGGHDASAAFIALCWPIVDPVARYRMVQAKGVQRLVDAHHAYWPTEAEMSEGGPQSILERGETAATPPALLIQGTNDDNVTPDMAENFARSYRAAGGEIALEVFPGQTHAFIAKDPDAPDTKRALGLIADFVCAQAA